MRIAVVTSNFEPNQPGGVSNVAIRLIDLIRTSLKYEVSLISFPNSRSARNSIRFFQPSTFRTNIVDQNLTYNSLKMIEIGSFGSEFEFMRYRKRRELKSLFSPYDIIIVVTGFLQFANVIPKVDSKVFVQCATRLIWERSAQYPDMAFLRKLVLKSQYLFLRMQERRVLSEIPYFILENERMKSWISAHSKAETLLWYPTTNNSRPVHGSDVKNDLKNHFISVGRLNEPRKGWGRLMEAYSVAHQNNPGLPKLIIMGWGDLSDRDNLIFERVKKVSPIILMRNAENSTREQYVSASSYFLQASFEEGLGLAALEALESGIPLICAETDGSSEYLVNGQNGILVSQGKDFVSRFARAILESQFLDYPSQSNQSVNIFKKKFSPEVNDYRLLALLREIEFKN